MESVVLDMSPEDLAEIEKRAAACGMSASEFVVMKGLQPGPRDRTLTARSALIKERIDQLERRMDRVQERLEARAAQAPSGAHTSNDPGGPVKHKGGRRLNSITHARTPARHGGVGNEIEDFNSSSPGPAPDFEGLVIASSQRGGS